VVSIRVDSTRAFDTEWNSSSQATGFVVDAERGLILTNGAMMRSAGTADGTYPVVTPDAGPMTHPRTFGHGAVVVAYKIGAGYELWGTDGTPEGGDFVADLAPGEDSARYEDPFVSVGDDIVFVADDLTHGRQLWWTDGTTGGTFPLTSFPAGAFPPNLFPLDLAGAGDFALIQVDDGVHGAEMWRTDGTVDGTRLLLDACPGPCSSMASGIQVFETGTAWFYTFFDGDTALWRTDGTPEGTHLFTDACPGGCSFHLITPVGGSIVAPGVDADGQWGIYAFDDQAPEARLLAEFPGDLVPYYRSRAGETVVFVVDDGVHGEELWRTDGSAEGTFLLRDLVTPEDLIVPPAASPPSAPLHLSAEPVGGDAVRLRWDDTAGDELRFEVERIWAGADFYRRIATVPEDGEVFVAEGLTPGRPYSFRVRAVNAAGASAWSNEASATPAAPAAGPCVPSDEALCLLGGRFEVRVAWRDQHNGGFGVGHAAPFPGSARTGTFWFFNQANVELIVKELDGGPVNGHFWTFYGALSDVEYWVTVTDTEARTNRTYHNPPGEICGRGDTFSFPAGIPVAGEAATGGGRWPNVLEDPAGGLAPAWDSPVGAPGPTAHAAPAASTVGAGSAPGPRAPAFARAPLAAPGSTGTCVPGAETLCLLGGRFRVEVTWHDQHNGGDGVGHAVAGTDKSGYFWFFNQANVELVV
jgi:ELWxxDGT repeat protein